jgi:hypothetical protein
MAYTLCNWSKIYKSPKRNSKSSCFECTKVRLSQFSPVADSTFKALAFNSLMMKPYFLNFLLSG